MKITSIKTWVETHKKQAVACSIATILIVGGMVTGLAITNQQTETKDAKTETSTTETKDSTSNMNDTDTTKNANADTETAKAEKTDATTEKENVKADKGEKPANNTQTQAPAKHQHNWKTNTTQKWVSNMVTVDDYENQQVAVGSYAVFAYDGFKAATKAEHEQHAKELILAGKDDGYQYEIIYETQRVKVGSHQEDHGHYETITYQYCDCGATK